MGLFTFFGIGAGNWGMAILILLPYSFYIFSLWRFFGPSFKVFRKVWAEWRFGLKKLTH